MARPELRVYYGPNDERNVEVRPAYPRREQFQVPLGDLIDTLIDAAKKDRSWVNDFRDEEVAISTDLYEVILAYQHYRRPSA